MTLRKLVLAHGKTLLVPHPALSEESFAYVLAGKELAERACTKKGAAKHGRVLRRDSPLEAWAAVTPLELYVVASVAVAANGVRIGKGKGYAEIEWAVLRELGVVNETTVVLTTVHDEQLFTEASFSSSS